MHCLLPTWPQVEMCGLKLDRAEQLISGLGGEKDRWTEAAHALRSQFNGLMVGACWSVCRLGGDEMRVKGGVSGKG